MKNLKLNQLNEQKVTESEMNRIKGGTPLHTYYDVNFCCLRDECDARCTDTFSLDGFSGGLKVFI